MLKMTSSQNLSEARLITWLQLFGGPGYKGEETRDRAIEEMRELGVNKLFPLLMLRISDSNTDIDIRCNASRALLFIDAKKGIELLPQTVGRQNHLSCSMITTSIIGRNNCETKRTDENTAE